jgi:hypothetical protein
MSVRIATIVVLAGIGIACSGPTEGSGRIATATLPVTGSFAGIEVGGALQVEVTAGPDVSVTVTADDNLVPLCRTEVADGVLRVRTDGAFSSKNPFVVRVVASVGNRFTVKASDAASVTASLRCDDVEINAEGSARVSGTSSRTARVVVSGETRVDLDVVERLHANARGTAIVRYGGDPDVEGLVGAAASVERR